MEFKHVRGNALILFDKLIEIPLLIAIVIGSFVMANNFDWRVMATIIVLALSPLSGFARYVSTYYTLEEGHLIVESGIFVKKRMELPIRQITTVDLSQNILYQFLKTYKIKVDNASQTVDTIDQSEVRLALKADKAFEFKRIITQSDKYETKTNSEADLQKIIPSSKDFLLLGLLQSKIMIFLTGGPIAVPAITAIAALATQKKSGNEVLDMVLGQTSSAVALIGGGVLFFYFIALGLSIGKSLLFYYNFRISENRDSLKIAYGLFNKKKFTFHKKKISGILLKQNLLMRLFHYYTVELLVIGYGDHSEEEGQEHAILYPIASIEKISIMIKEILPEFALEYALQKPRREARRYFFYRPGFLAAVVIVIISVLLNKVVLIAAAGGILVLAAISVLLQFHNSGIFCGETNVILSFGGFRRTIAAIRSSDIESITARGSQFKRKKGIVTIKVGFLAPLRSANLKVLNLPAEQYELLGTIIEY